MKIKLKLKHQNARPANFAQYGKIDSLHWRIPETGRGGRGGRLFAFMRFLGKLSKSVSSRPEQRD